MDETPINAIELEILNNALRSISDEMALTIFRTGHSTIIRDGGDFATALLTADCELLAQGLTVPQHLGAMPDALGAVIKKFGDDIHRGDVFLLNDPYNGGMHLPDVFVFKPIFVDSEGDRPVAFVAAVAHHADMGGRVPGSNAADSTEIYQEGIRFPVVRLFSRGEPNASVFDILAANVRLPEMVTGDIHATVAACNYGEREFLKLVDQHGLPWLKRYLAALLDYAEALTRAEIEALPDGTYRFDDFIDDDGLSEEPIPLHLALTVDGDNITVDFTGSSPMVRGALNATESFTKASTYLALRCVFDADIPNNGGFMRPITIIAPKGTILNVELPGACAARGLTGFRVSELVLAALGKAMPSKAMAASEGGNTFVTIGGTRDNGKPFVHCDLIFGAWGGSHFRSDGDAMALVASNCTNIPIEVIEAEYPLLCEQYSFVSDSGGAGKSRGGLALVRDFRLTEGRAILQVRSDRRAFRPWALEEGKPGTQSWNYINPADGTNPLPSKVTTELRKGDVFRHVTGGGGGFGSPFERDGRLVQEDVLNGKISRDYAEKEYGVVLRKNGGLDESATAQRRSTAR